MWKKLIKKMKSVKFWLSLTSAVVLVMQLLGLKISAPYINEIASAVCSVFVILGIMVPDASDDGETGDNGNDVTKNNASGEIDFSSNE